MPNEPKQIAIVRPKYPLRIKSPQHTNIKIPGAQPTATAIINCLSVMFDLAAICGIIPFGITGITQSAAISLTGCLAFPISEEIPASLSLPE